MNSEPSIQVSKKQKIDHEHIESLDEEHMKIKTNCKQISLNSSVWLNIGGQLFCTRASTLTLQSKYFQALFESEFDENENGKTQQTAIFIDRDPKLFQYILSYLRNCRYTFEYPTPKYHLNVRDEFEYFCISRPIRFYVYVNEKTIDYHAIPTSLLPLLCAESSIRVFDMGAPRMYFPDTSKYDYLLPSLYPKCVRVTQHAHHRVNYLFMEKVIINAGYEIIENSIDTNLYIFQNKLTSCQ
jgi:hypothetical protein